MHVREKAQKERESRKSGPDFTRYDIRIKGELFPDQWKRRALYLVVKALLTDGVSPEEIAEVEPGRRSTMFCHIDGVHGSKDFVLQMVARSPGFKSSRWFCDDDELFHVDGRTYAFSNQWGIRWSEVMSTLSKRYPKLDLSFLPTVVNE